MERKQNAIEESDSRTIRRFLSNPALNGWGVIVGIAGLIFAGYTYWDSKTIPLLAAQVSSLRTIIASSEPVEDLQILAGGKLIKGPITAAQIAVWNAGKRPIRSEDVLERIAIATAGNAPIISARILRVTREIAGVTLDDSLLAEGRVGVRFHILEEGDGALLQLTYLGDANVAFSGSGAIVGQKRFGITRGGQITPRWLQIAELFTFPLFCFFTVWAFVASAKDVKARYDKSRGHGFNVTHVNWLTRSIVTMCFWLFLVIVSAVSLIAIVYLALEPISPFPS